MDIANGRLPNTATWRQSRRLRERAPKVELAPTRGGIQWWTVFERLCPRSVVFAARESGLYNRGAGGLGKAIAAARLARRNDAVDLPVEAFDLVMDVNVKGTWLSAQAVGRHMIERGRPAPRL